MRPTPRIERDARANSFPAHAQRQIATGRDDEQTLAARVNVREDGARALRPVDLEPERDGEGGEVRDGSAAQDGVAGRPAGGELQARVEASRCGDNTTAAR